MSENSLLTEASVVKSFFLGNLIEENLFPYPSFSSEEVELLSMVLESIDRFMDGKEETFREFDVAAKQSEEFVNSLKELGLFGLIIGEEYGGIGLSNSGYARVMQQLTRYDGSTAITVGAHSSIGMKGLLLFGNEEQKSKYLPKLASGETIAAFCLTEPGAGSDAASIKTTAKKNSDGDWVLNGEKLWISNGPIAGFFTVFAQTDSGDAGKMSAFIVEAGSEGLTTGPKEDKMGIRASCTSTVILQDVVVPKENLLGEEGKGFKVAMNILNNGRTGLGGGCVGAMKRVIELAVQQATDRKQFGQPIAEFGLIQAKIAQMTVDCFAGESVCQMIGHYIDSGVEDYSVEAAVSKVFVSEALWRSGNEALQIAGGNGYMKEYPYEMIVRDSRINLIFEGTNEILRLFIALSGMKEAGRYLKDIGKAAENIFSAPIKGFGLMGGYASKKITQFTSLGREKIPTHPALEEYAKVYELGILGISKASEDMLRKYGKKIINEQFVLSRIANAAIDVFVGLSMLSRVQKLIEEKGIDKVQQEVAILQIFTRQARSRIRSNLYGAERDEDALMKDLSHFIVEQGKYPWDSI